LYLSVSSENLKDTKASLQMKNKKKNQNSQYQFSLKPLTDLNSSGKERPWRKHKLESLVISGAYSLILELKRYGEQMASCGNYLLHGVCPHGEHGKRLIEAYFCKSRLCVMCQWRKSLIIRKQVIDLVHWHQEKYSTDVPILLTLTIVNEKGESLNKGIDQMTAAWRKLMRLKVVKGAVRSWFRSLELTYNEDRNDYHPHFHALLMVPHHYFYKERGLYIPHEKWLNLWRQCMRDDRITQVNVKKMKKRQGGTLEGLVGEVAKYATKPSSYIFKNEEGESYAPPEVIENLHYALKGRRMVGYGGFFSKIRKEKKMVEVENANLVQIDEEGVHKECSCRICESTLLKELSGWHFGAKQYLKMKLVESSEDCSGFHEEESCDCMTESKVEVEPKPMMGVELKTELLSESRIEKAFEVEDVLEKKKYLDRKEKKPSLLLETLKREVQRTDYSKKEGGSSRKPESSWISLRAPP
jgi:plasmid rolling circle replication initiator protein Rep